MSRHRCLGWMLALVLWVAAIPAAEATDFGRYHNYAELSAALKTLVAAHPGLARMTSIGRTHEGRDIWVVEVASQKGRPVGDRPALLVAASFEGDHLIGSELALFLVDHLLRGYAADPVVRQRLDEHVIYVVPRVNPDGAERMFAQVRTGRRTNATPYDGDNDGRTDEDGPDDLNGDRQVTLMRVKDPKGPYMISPEDPRLMKKADPARGEVGGYAIYWEGLDEDGDGFYNEDGPGGVDINRNFMHQYPAFEETAGRYMVSENETRALLDFVLARRHIAAILAFGESDNLVVPPNRRGEAGAAPLLVDLFDFADASYAEARKVGMFEEPGAGSRRGFGGRPPGGMMPGGQRPGAQPTSRAAMPARRPATTVNAADVDYFRAVSDKYRELTGVRATGVSRAPAGAFFEYGYYQYGVPSFSTPGWGLPPAGPPGAGGGGGAEGARSGAVAGSPPAMARGRGSAPSPAGAGDGPAAAHESVDLRLLRWMDAEKVDGFVAWTPFTHPTLGAVEIGGFTPYATTNPPATSIAALGESHAKFALYLTSLFPKVSVADARAQPLGAGLYRVQVEIQNTGYFPTAMAHAAVARAVRPTMVRLEVPPETIVTGAEKTTYVQALNGSGGRHSLEWVIRAKPGTAVKLTLVAQKGGSDTATIALK